MQITTIEWHRPRHNVIEWTLTNELGERHINHSNRTATFFGSYDGNYSSQWGGGAWTPWDESDAKVTARLRGKYRFRARVAKQSA